MTSLQDRLQPIVLVDDDVDLLEEIAESFRLDGYRVTACGRADDALMVLNAQWSGAIVSDLRMAGLSGHQFLAEVQLIDPDIPFIMITGHGEMKEAIAAIKAGAYDFLEKPIDPEILRQTVQRAHDRRSLVLENRRLRNGNVANDDLAQRFIGCSEAAIEVRKAITALARLDIDLLVMGETGTGKDVVARCLHDFSSRKAGPFVAVNCGALPDTLIDSALFGHERGAFTGAERRHIGYFETAHRGTLFLDELESMPLALQARLLRILETRSVERLGSNSQPEQVDIRVIAAVKGDLDDLIAAGQLRADLVYRINVAAINLPPLRERQRDLSFLFMHFCRQAASAHDIAFTDPSESLLSELRNQQWPGNIRELRNFAERFVIGLPSRLNGGHSFRNSNPDDCGLDAASSTYRFLP